MPKCTLCGGKANKEDICYGCHAFICEGCEKENGVSAPHLFEKHLEIKKEKEENKENPVAQAQALEEAWRKGVERAKIMAQKNRFSRGPKAGEMR